MTAKVYLVRHGATEYTEQERFQGWADVPLSDLGRQQMKAVAAAIDLSGLAALVCSDLRRAREGAELIAARYGIPIREDPRLRERSMGPWEGLTRAEVAARYPEDFARWLGNCSDAPGLEPDDALSSRVLAARDEALRLAAGAPLALVTHAGPVKALIADALGCRLAEMRGSRVDLGSVSEIELTDYGTWMLRRMNWVPSCHG